MSDAIDEIEDPPEGIPFRGTGDVLRELGRVYRDMRKGRIAVADGNGLTQTLVQIGKVMEQHAETAALERLDALEKRKRVASPSVNPQAH